ncbi:hypothetical protein [Actinomadura harenae]|uniref:Uncharacterized protein n=1 Tax=Actinomadura harenae TaxID=2483351 RepID=A0A3M2LPC5_9ACTN|nr:hypothetical protein [Actinomadura harenae]RMI38946.1 hypothetical protein EBO15_31240 [Actinomadura harenae]
MRLPRQSSSVVRVPVPFVRKDVGLGDALKALTSAVGVKPCHPCAERAARLNRRVVLTGRDGRR